jgi:hypothetical protein
MTKQRRSCCAGAHGFPLCDQSSKTPTTHIEHVVCSAIFSKHGCVLVQGLENVSSAGSCRKQELQTPECCIRWVVIQLTNSSWTAQQHTDMVYVAFDSSP